MRSLIVTLALCRAASLLGQSDPDWLSCPVIAEMPSEPGSSEPLSDQQRFELRQCYGEKMIVTGYERAKARPSLIFDTGDNYPRLLVHAMNILVFQSLGGSADHVYVFLFKAGKPSLALKTATKDTIQVRQSKAGVVLVVPPPVFPGPDGRFPKDPPPKEYRFSFAN